jgi:cyclophilin family peptidyl-prolyl cis-trans isomerase
MNSDKDGIRAIVRCGTSKGDIVMEFHRAWSPNGFDRAVSLFERGFYDYTHFYRVVKDFLVQFGITYSDDKELKHEANQPILDDPQLEPKIPFQMGTISYAGSGPNSRTSQLFIAYVAAKSFGTELWETPVGKVIEGMDHVQAFYSYGKYVAIQKGAMESFPIYDSYIDHLHRFICVYRRHAAMGQRARAKYDSQRSKVH